MKLRNISIIILSILLFSCNRSKTYEQNETIVTIADPPEVPSIKVAEYIENIDSNDITCLREIKRAKNDVQNGKLVFTTPMGFGIQHLRQEKQLKELCQAYKLLFDYEMFGCVIVKGQTQGCYGAYMTKAIEDKYGKGFKQILLAKADSLLLAKNDTIPYYLCDIRPQIPGQNDHDRLFPNINQKIKMRLKPNNEGSFPFMAIGFYISKEGTASGYFINYFYDADNELNQKFKDELFKIGVEQLKAIKHWETGIVNGQKVNTENNVRVYF